MENHTDLLRQIRDEVINLTTSPLYAERQQNNVFPVIGEGNHQAKAIFVGEAPGKKEAATGRPFCGAAGSILDELFESISVDRMQVYVTNIVKDRPPMNRDPYPEEIALYAPFLDRQIQIIQPSTIVSLGRFSMEYLMEKLELLDKLQAISKIHGQLFPAKTPYGVINFVPLYHPAVAVYNSDTKQTLVKDFHALKDLL